LRRKGSGRFSRQMQGLKNGTNRILWDIWGRKVPRKFPRRIAQYI